MLNKFCFERRKLLSSTQINWGEYELSTVASIDESIDNAQVRYKLGSVCGVV